MKPSIGLFFLALLCSDAEAQRDAPIGEVRFATPGKSAWLCPDPVDILGCGPFKSGKLTVTGPPRSGRAGGTYYEVSAGRKDGLYIRDLDWIRLRSEGEQRKVEAQAKECDRRGGASVGMTKDQVIASCWGKAKRINATTTAAGTREQWVYGPGNYLYFDETGLLTAIQN